MDIPYFVYSSVHGHLGFFYFWAVVNNSAISSNVHIFVRTYVFISLGYTLRSGISGSYIILKQISDLYNFIHTYFSMYI